MDEIDARPSRRALQKQNEEPCHWLLIVEQIVFLKLAGSTGLEPAASGVTGRRSNQLNYDPLDELRS